MCDLKWDSSSWIPATVIGVAIGLLSPPSAHAERVVRTAFAAQCPVTLETTTPPARRNESLGVLGGAIFTSVADSLLDAGINWVKTALDPTKGEFSDKRSSAVTGLFEGQGHNIDLNCLVIGVFDDTQAGTIALPINPAFARRGNIEERAGFLAGDSIPDRVGKVLGQPIGKPLIYVELARAFSRDSTAHYYRPVYAYAGEMIKPHFLSQDPVWEISVGWTDPSSKAIGGWAMKFGGQPPLEKGPSQLALLGAAWGPLKNPPKDAAVGAFSGPFTLEVEVKEHRSPTLFASAIQKAAADNSAAARQMIRDAYPWRQDEVAATSAAAASKARDDLRQKTISYLAGIDAYKAACAQAAADPVKRARCGLDQVNLTLTFEAIKDDVTRLKLMPNGVDLPQAPAAP